MQVVSCDGMLRVFDVAQQRCIVKCSADPILPKASSGIGFGLTKLSLTSQHVPLLGFVDPGSKPSDAVGLSSIFAFHADLDAWMMISNSRSASLLLIHFKGSNVDTLVKLEQPDFPSWPKDKSP